MNTLDVRHQRLAMTDALMPPSGYRLGAAIGTTYSLDFDALTAVLLAFSGAESDGEPARIGSTVTGFDRLHPAVQHHIVNSLGWPSLRPFQEQVIAPILDDQDALVVAPTAGGKTEAASFPILSRMLSESWTSLSVLYLCPLRALLNNLEPRLSQYASLVGRRVAMWHGDVGDPARRKILADLPDILLTTPESLEVMLVSARVDHASMFANVRAVIVDEVHAFASDDRGWHLGVIRSGGRISYAA